MKNESFQLINHCVVIYNSFDLENENHCSKNEDCHLKNDWYFSLKASIS